MRTSLPFVIVVAILTSACELGAVSSPTIVPGPTTAAVPTNRPNMWDNRAELAAWVENGVTTGPVSIIGDGDEAFIRIELGTTGARIQGPDFAPTDNFQTARIRYRWPGGSPSDLTTLYLTLRPVMMTPTSPIPYLFMVTRRSADWLEQDFTPNQAYSPPFSARFAVLGTNAGTLAHGVIDIDWIALVTTSAGTDLNRVHW